ncbi:MAG: ATP-binding protein [Lachnospiraceae bacterium]|nr:ATP-binding protein [Lachnospiraceae bacterium]
MNTWTMHVEKFGKIESADIEVAPMTLFVGDNNSGKSYIMTLIYGLINIALYAKQYEIRTESEDYIRCIKFVDRIHDNTDYMVNSFKSIEMTLDEMKAFEGVLNELLALNKDRFIRDLFNKRIDIGGLSLELKKHNKYILRYNLSYMTNQEEYVTLQGISGKNKMMLEYCSNIERRESKYEHYQAILFILEYMIKGSFGDATYFPTARTGYVLTFKSLIGSALREKFNFDTTQKNLLTRPNSDFLIKLSELTKSDLTDKEWRRSNRTQSAVRIIESNIIEGKISISDMPAHDIVYQPQGTDTQLPMFVASGVVTEMTPLLLFFRNDIVNTVLIEEPEISLHPQLQCEMARVLIRLANSRIPVFVTTHSDIILQHINNMIKLAAASNREAIGEKLGYEECDWIDREKVKVYQFDMDSSQRTTVIKLPCGDFGFEAMTFYDTLEELNRQTRIIEEE